MRKLTIVLVSLCLSAVMLSAASAKAKTLFDRLGGKDAIKAVVDEFVSIAAADTRINGKFGKTDIDRLKTNLVDQICGATGGPCKYKGLDMKTSHKNMGVTEGEFGALVEDLVKALDKFKVPEKEKKELLGLLGPMKPQIVEVKSADTGTPLPAGFKPAPPLKGDMMKADSMKSDKKKSGKMAK